LNSQVPVSEDVTVPIIGIVIDDVVVYEPPFSMVKVPFPLTDMLVDDPDDV